VLFLLAFSYNSAAPWPSATSPQCSQPYCLGLRPLAGPGLVSISPVVAAGWPIRDDAEPSNINTAAYRRAPVSFLTLVKAVGRPAAPKYPDCKPPHCDLRRVLFGYNAMPCFIDVVFFLTYFLVVLLIMMWKSHNGTLSDADHKYTKMMKKKAEEVRESEAEEELSTDQYYTWMNF
jgi:hypothetical protein